MTEISICEIINTNKSLKNEEYEGVNERILKRRELLTRNLNNFISLKALSASSLISLNEKRLNVK